jgi:antitoxin CptB
MTGTTRSSEGLDVRRRRLLFRAWRRGTRELDLVMGRFLDEAIATMSEAEVDEFERLCDVPDLELYAWVVGSRPAPAQYDTELFRRICAFDHAAAAGLDGDKAG